MRHPATTWMCLRQTSDFKPHSKLAEAQPKPMRNSRTKSKLGCSQCKLRRVKCDEGRPDCKNCVRRQIECSFRKFDPTPRSFVAKTQLPVGTSLSPEGPRVPLAPPSFLDALPQDELLKYFPDVSRPRFKQLLQHFAIETSPTITHSDAAQAAWCAAVPQLTARHPFVLQGAMAMSALHLSKHTGIEREQKYLRDIAALQMNTGLIRYREAISNVTEANAESLFVYSIATTVWIFFTTADDFRTILGQFGRLEQGPRQRRVIETKLVSYVSRVLRTLRGVLVILVPCWHLVANGILADVAKRDWWPYPVPTSPEALEDDRRLASLEALWMQPGHQYEYNVDALRQALKSLRDDFARVSQLTVSQDAKSTRYGRLVDWTCVLTWPIALPLAFVELVEARRPEAWVILAHYAILPAKVEFIFWINEFAPNIIMSAAMVLGRDMCKWIRWPAEVVGVDLDRFAEPLQEDALI